MKDIEEQRAEVASGVISETLHRAFKDAEGLRGPRDRAIADIVHRYGIESAEYLAYVGVDAISEAEKQMGTELVLSSERASEQSAQIDRELDIAHENRVGGARAIAYRLKELGEWTALRALHSDLSTAIERTGVDGGGLSEICPKIEGWLTDAGYECYGEGSE